MSVTLTTPVDPTVRFVEFKVADVVKSTPPVPAFKIAVVVPRLPVALMPPAASDAVNVNDVPELAASCTTPAKVSVTLTAPVASVMVRLVALSVPALLKSIPPVPAVRFALAEPRFPVALMPPPRFDALSVNDVPELAPSCTTPANVSLIMTAPVPSETVRVVAFNEPDVLKSTPPVPALNVVVAEASAPVALIPPAASEAFKIKDEPELALSETTPAKVSLTVTAPVESVMLNVAALVVPAALKSMPPVPAVNATVPEARLPVALIPPAAFEAFNVNAEPELAAS